jgi:hypothetical protein
MIDYNNHHRQTPDLNLTNIYPNDDRFESNNALSIRDTEQLNDSSTTNAVSNMRFFVVRLTVHAMMTNKIVAEHQSVLSLVAL